MLRSGRKLVAVLVALSAVAVALAIAGIGNAGSAAGDMHIVGVFPVNLTSGQQGLVKVTFKVLPSSTGNGTATHIQSGVTIHNTGANTLKVLGCPGTPSYSSDGLTAYCNIQNLQVNIPITFYVTFNAGNATNPDQAQATGLTTFDQGQGSSSGQSSSAQTPSGEGLFTVYPRHDDNATNIYAGTCASAAGGGPGAVPLQIAGGPNGNGKGDTLKTDFGASAGSGFPCTPAYVGVDASRNVNFKGQALSPGVWTALFSPLQDANQNNQPAQLTLTLTTLPSYVTSASKMALYEIGPPPDNLVIDQVLKCDATGKPTNGLDSCITSQGKFGPKGVQFVLNVSGSLTDPSYTG